MKKVSEIRCHLCLCILNHLVRNKYGKINQWLNNSVDPVTHDRINTNHSVPTVVQIISNKPDLFSLSLLSLLSPLFSHSYKFISLSNSTFAYCHIENWELNALMIHLTIFSLCRYKTFKCCCDAFDRNSHLSAIKWMMCAVWSVCVLFGYCLSLSLSSSWPIEGENILKKCRDSVDCCG